MRILIATDAFPPICGGSGWSTYELARGLRRRGHEIVVVQPYEDRPPPEYDGFNVIGFRSPAPSIPFVRNYFRNERLYRRLSAYLAGVIRRERIDIVHAQHQLTGPAAIRAAHAAAVPAICTIRDYWPMCYWGDLVRDPAAGDLCPGCSTSAMTRCLKPRGGAVWPLSLPMIPYMQSNLAAKQYDVASADAIVAVSRYVAEALRHRAALSGVRIETLPNGVDIAQMRAQVRASARPLSEPYAIFIGKLAHNKGVDALVDVVKRAKLRMPLVVIGDGPARASLIAAATDAAADVRVLPWLGRDDVFRWLGYAAMLVFPSNWPEPLSRVLIEASALSVPIAAMNTGGTSDVIVDERTGLLSSSIHELADDVARLAADESLRQRLGKAAGERAELLFDIHVVVDEIQRLYADVVARFQTRRRTGAA